MKKKGYKLYIAAMVGIMIIPFVGMSRWKTMETTENKELSEWPHFIENKKINTDYLKDMGTYFEEHMAFRLQMLTANSVIQGKLFHTSTTEQVIVGKDDWLYFGGTKEDYTGQEQLSDRELYNVVHNLAMVQNYVEQNGAKFLLAVVPNKNTLYDENMPYFYRRGKTSNLERLNVLLNQYGIHYVDLKEEFKKKDEVLYFKRDTHWNNKGAVLAYDKILDSLGKKHQSYLNVAYEKRVDHIGDIDKILYPLAYVEEENYYFDRDWGYEYVNKVTDNMDAWIETVNPEKQGILLMYRDSFGESLLPFMAEEYGEAYFSRLVPYNLENLVLYHPDTVIIERVERKISAFAAEVPIMEAPVIANISAAEKKTKTTIDVWKNGGYLGIYGNIDQKIMTDNTEIYVSVSDEKRKAIKTYQPFYTLTNGGNGNGYSMYLKYDELPSETLHINVISRADGEEFIIQSKEISLKNLQKKGHTDEK